MVAVDTGSRDRSGAVLTTKLGQAAVFGMDRSTGYGAAVRRALQHKAASAPLPVGQAGGGGGQAGQRSRSEQVEWIWLLHDDCEPAPDALEQLLRGAAETPTAAVFGPKLKDWTDRDVILEAGLSLDSVGRRITGVEPREVDQGQHDGDRDVLAVSSAGMLIRRDVWDQVGGFDPGMTLFGEDVDLCWRVHAAGFRVRVITDAVIYHAMAATKGRRPISVGRRARLLDRRHALQTLLWNLPPGPMVASLVANLTISLIRTVFYMVAKRGTAALDETAAVAAVVGHPLRFAAARRRRAHGRRAAYGRVRADLPSGRSLRRAAEFLALVVSRSAKQEAAAGHSAIDDPTDDDSLLIDTGFLQRFVTRPGVLLMFGLIIVTAVAERSLIGGGPLGGGALLPAWEGASTLWGEVLRAYHPSGIGSASAAPPYAAFVAVLATILAGKVWLAIDVLLLGAVPLAGLTSVLALRRVTKSPRVRVWAAASYALLPVAIGAVAAGRLGSAVAFVLIPLIGLQAGRMFSESPRQARRAAWATGLAVTVGTAFVPLLWPIAVAAAVLAAITLRASRSLLINLGIVAATPPVLLGPWMLQLLAHPSALLLEAGVQQPGLASTALPARSLILLSPGGPGVPPYWVSAALLVTGLTALLATRRRVLIVSGWSVALLGFATAIAVSRAVVTPAGGQVLTPWPGPALAVAAAGLLLAAAAGAEGLGRTLSARGGKGRRRVTSMRGFAVVILSLVGVSAPLLAATYWVMNGIGGPIDQATGEVVPAVVAPPSAAGRQLRTLVLTSDHGHVSYLLLREDSPELTDSGLVPVTAAQTALGKAVSALVAPGGDQTASQSQLLAHFDIGYVLMRAPLSPGLASVLNEVAGLSQDSMTPAFDLWRLTTAPSRASVVEPNGAVVAVSSGPVGVSGASAPAAGGTLELAEPAGGWSAAVNGHALTAIPSPAGSWAQAFKLPPGGGTLTVSRNGLTHDLLAGLELLAFLVVGVLALPGVRTAAELAAAASAAQAQLAGEEASAQVPAPGERADKQPAAPGRPGRPVRADRSARAGRSGRAARAGRAGRAARADRGSAVAGQSGTRRRSEVPKPDTEETAQVPADRGRPLRGGAGKAAAGLVGGARTAGRRGGASLPGAGAAAGAARAPRAGSAGLGGPAAGAPAAGAGSAARAAWPAGQPASRFLSGPPASASYQPGREEDPGPWSDHPVSSGSDGRPLPGPAGPAYDDPLGGGTRHPAMPYDDRRSVPAPSPSGSRYDEMPSGGPADRHQPFPGRPAETRSPSGNPYLDEPVAPPGGSHRSYEPDAGLPGRNWRDAAPPPGPGRPDAGLPGEHWRDTAPPQGPGRDWDRPQQAHGWSGGDQQPSWEQDSRASGWPEPARQHGWPQGQPQEYRDGYQTGSAPGQAPAWNVADQGGWPDSGDALEALPPIAEVHHDWPVREERPRRGWIAPEDETDGETW